MRTYAITDGDTLVLSVNGCAWQTLAFTARDFADAGAATAQELAEAVRRRARGVAATVEADGSLVLASEAQGGHAELRVDAERSTAATALGLLGDRGRARGAGLSAARLTSPEAEPFELARGAELTLSVDGKRRRLTFESGFTERRATAAELAEAIEGKVRGIACATPDGRLVLTSPTVGAGSSLQVERGREDRPDAAAALGFTGEAATSDPYPTAPARLPCAGPPAAGTRVTNLTASPIELHLPTGTVLLPARGALPISPADLAYPPLQNLLGQGAVRLAAPTGD